MKLSRKQLRRIIFEEIQNLNYKQSKSVETSPIDYNLSSEVEAHEDAWAGGRNIQNQVDHLEAGGSKEKSVRGIERLRFNETREKHIQGLQHKIGRLEPELVRQETAADYWNQQRDSEMEQWPDDPYAGRDAMDSQYSVNQQIYGIKRKIDLLKKQLHALESAEGGHVGELPRGDAYE